MNVSAAAVVVVEEDRCLGRPALMKLGMSASLGCQRVMNKHQPAN